MNEFYTNRAQMNIALHDKAYLSDAALRKRLNVDDLISHGKTDSDTDSNNDQLVLILSDKRIITKEEVATYFKIKSSEKGDAYKKITEKDKDIRRKQ